MTKKLTRHGNSLALVLDRPVLDLLRIDDDTPLNISTDGQVLVVAPVRSEKREQEFKDALTWSHRRYGKTFKTLAG